MSGVHRFLSKRDRSQNRKHHLGRQHDQHPDAEKSTPEAASKPVEKPVDPSSAADFYGLFNSRRSAPANAEEHKIKVIRKRLLDSKGVVIRDGVILWALRSHMSNGNNDAAYDLLLAMSDASEGMIKEYSSTVKLRGAQNRQGVTCFLDSTLFSMFSRLDSFEAMLYNSFPDIPRNKLGFLLRLWVNLLRSGQLITTDITQTLQEAIAECGWPEAADLHQQDASEAFTFITGKLELPLLTLKMDIYHTGKEDAADDHKFINERLLDVAIPEDPSGQRKEITLEDCLEDYFNNRIEVRRYLERRSTVNAMNTYDGKEKGGSIHIETIEVDPDSSPATPLGASPSIIPAPRPANRNRTQSIIQERYIPARGESGFSSLTNVDTKESSRSRAGSIRKEVMMPAWQFFSLIPWYTDNAPSNDAQVAAHFSSKRPVLGLCLKRYAINKGKAVRLNTQVDVPVEIGLPHFIQDDHIGNDGTSFGNFKLSLQSVVCHRGNSVDSGHYVALVRGTTSQSGPANSVEDAKHWIRFDDLAQERITLVDIHKALKEETPYLLFYQIVPIEGDPGHIMAGEHLSSTTLTEDHDLRGPPSSTSLISSTDASSGRPSFEIPFRDDPRGRSLVEARRPSIISFSEATLEPNQSSRGTSPARPSSRRMSADMSRTVSRTSDGLGIGRTLSRLTNRKSHSRDPPSVSSPFQQLPRSADAVVSQVIVREMSETTSVATEPQLKSSHGHLTAHHIQITLPHHVPVPVPHQLKDKDKGYKRDRSKNRLMKGQGKVKDHHPDRECIVM